MVEHDLASVEDSMAAVGNEAGRTSQKTCRNSPPAGLWGFNMDPHAGLKQV